MIVFPNCKINLGLHITGKRPDGFHNLETVFYPVPLCDALEIIPSPDGSNHFGITGISLPDSPGDNLCEKAYTMLASHYSLPPVHMHLHKHIPAGAGLGGGSADASFTLVLLNELFNLNIPDEGLLKYAAQLGSDCSFFIRNEPAYATGRGEILSQSKISLKDWHIALVKPPVNISTAEAFAGIAPSEPGYNLQHLLYLPPAQWKGQLQNDFESGIFEKHPIIGDIKDKLYKMGATYASMSGSGAAVFALFEQKPETDLTQTFPDCFVWRGILC